MNRFPTLCLALLTTALELDKVTLVRQRNGLYTTLIENLVEFSRSKAYSLGPSTDANSDVCLMSDVCDNFEPCNLSTRFMRVISLEALL